VKITGWLIGKIGKKKKKKVAEKLCGGKLGDHCVQLYKDSFTAFADMKSPFIYPLYGLGECARPPHPSRSSSSSVKATVTR